MIKSLSSKEWKKFHDKDIDKILADARSWRSFSEWLEGQDDIEFEIKHNGDQGTSYNLGRKPIMGDVKMKLKPCPFCGSKASTYEDIWFYVRCNKTHCSASSDGWFSKKLAINAWNRRSSLGYFKQGGGMAEYFTNWKTGKWEEGKPMNFWIGFLMGAISGITAYPWIYFWCTQ